MRFYLHCTSTVLCIIIIMHSCNWLGNMFCNFFLLLLRFRFKTNPNFSVTPKLRLRPRPVVISNEEIPSEIKPKSYPPRTGIHSITNPTSSSSSLGVQPNQLQHHKQHSASLEEKLDEIATKWVVAVKGCENL